MALHLIRAASVLSGHGIGRSIGVPTLNIDPTLAPKGFSHGIYACWVTLHGLRYKGALHFGPRPAFKDIHPSFEVHVLDAVIASTPPSIDLTIVEKIRDIEDFVDSVALKKRIDQDIAAVHAILSAP